ncbi:MFS transporter [Pseudomonas cremoricolorata]|uniref:MFS transporter n=1 Tax=Pseudomonas cremoricolorata TaxID=157783 RepID=A0A089WQ66_9PSED|nr:MFS transporter [Pseudomonas cremoricolorata]AIR90711.1 MFS transporter [Pseudomonas cremoricolorata]
MLTPYKELFSAPGTLGFTLAGLLARLALPMTGIGIITMLAQLQGSYTLAGRVCAVFVLSYAVASPQISRLVDRRGQRRILPVATAVSVLGFAILLAGAWRQTVDWPLYLGAVLAGCMPSVSAMVRARWTALYRGQPRLQTAYSLEAVLDEVTFIIGPPLSVGLSIAVLPQAGPVAAAVLLVIGIAALAAQTCSAPAPEAQVETSENATSLLRQPSVQLLAALMMAMGVIVGSVDIVSVAFAEHVGQPAAASLVLSAYAVGSCVAGLLFGTLELRTPLPRLLVLGALATAVATLPLTQVESIGAMALAVLLAGLFFAPTLIVAMSLVERLVPEHRLTEGLTWLLAGLNVGVALGAAAAGQVVDGNGAQAGSAVAVCAGAAVVITALAGYLHLRPRRLAAPDIA